jgi:hypothetical protein
VILVWEFLNGKFPNDKGSPKLEALNLLRAPGSKKKAEIGAFHLGCHDGVGASNTNFEIAASFVGMI